MSAKGKGRTPDAAGIGADVPSSVIRQLAHFWERNGYLRRQAENRIAKEGPRRYKKGFEVRLVANSTDELESIRGLLRAAGFRPGRPFAKGRQYRQPLYGRQAVARFLALLGGPRNIAGGSPPNNALRRMVSRVTARARGRHRPRHAARR
jgi:hypothetical protein